MNLSLPVLAMPFSSVPKSVIFFPKFTKSANRSSAKEPSKLSVSLFFSLSLRRSFLRTAKTSSAAPHKISLG